MTINISKTNPLRAIYRLWLSLGGEPKTPEDLCHFMRVCMFFWWMRWLFSAVRYNPDRPKDRYRHSIGERFPRIAIFGLFTFALCVVIGLINEGVLWYTALVVLATIVLSSLFAVFVFGATQVGKKVNENEMFETFKDYL